eukprot:11984123-Ditylum_brightwellii.AAC.1
MGRWSWVMLQGKKKRLVTCIAVYRVCKNILANAGPSTCWMQQLRQLKKQGISKPDPRKQFLIDLSKFMNELQDKEHELIISLDSNEDSGEDRHFSTFITDNDLIDAYKHKHPGSHLATYLR